MFPEQVVHNLRDAVFASHSCVVGFSVMGIWPDGADGTDVNALDRASRGFVKVASSAPQQVIPTM
jgi:hypothetical protein